MIIRRSDFPSSGIALTPDSTEASEEVCVDLHVGGSFMQAGNSTSFPFDKPYKLEPGACIIVHTEETISLPNDCFGTLCAKGSLAALGFIVPNTKIDPLFSGGLDIALFNAGQRTLSVQKGTAFCSVVFHKLQGPITRNTPRSGIRVIELAQEKKWPRLAATTKLADQWKGVFAIAGGFLGFAASAITITYAILKYKGVLP